MPTNCTAGQVGFGKCCSAVWRVFSQVASCLAAGALLSCGPVSRGGSAPTGSDLSGTYAFEGLGGYESYQFPNPLVDFSDIRRGSDIRVIQREGTIATRYTNRAGGSERRSIDLGALPAGVRWDGGVLESKARVPGGDGFILPGVAVQHRGTRISRGDDGSLRIDGFHTETGAALFVVPFSDRSDYPLRLKRRGE